MKWLIVFLLSSLLSTSYCYNEKRLLQAFSDYPNLLYPVLQHHAILPDINTLKNSTAHLRVYANFKNPDAEALLADSFRENSDLYQSTLLNAGRRGSTLAKRKLETFLRSTSQWQKLQRLPWQISQSLQTQTAMALRQPLAANAEQVILTYTQRNCAAKLMLIVTDLTSFERVKVLKNRFENTFDLPICLSEPVYFDATQIDCSNRANARIECVLTSDVNLAQYEYDKLAFFSLQGIANAVGERLYMSYMQSERVLLHELMHLYGFIDEYPLKKNLAQRLCNIEQPTRIAKNILVLPDSNDLQNRVSFDDQTWYVTNTCNNANGQAFKPVSMTSNLELLDLPLPDLYRFWLQQAMTQDNSL